MLRKLRNARSSPIKNHHLAVVNAQTVSDEELRAATLPQRSQILGIRFHRTPSFGPRARPTQPKACEGVRFEPQRDWERNNWCRVRVCRKHINLRPFFLQSRRAACWGCVKIGNTADRRVSLASQQTSLKEHPLKHQAQKSQYTHTTHAHTHKTHTHIHTTHPTLDTPHSRHPTHHTTTHIKHTPHTRTHITTTRTTHTHTHQTHQAHTHTHAHTTHTHTKKSTPTHHTPTHTHHIHTKLNTQDNARTHVRTHTHSAQRTAHNTHTHT